MNPTVPNSPQTTAAVANALGGERTFAQISFPLTGDKGLDLASAVLAAIRELQISADDAAEVMEYLHRRFAAVVRHNEEWRRWSGAVGQGISSQGLPHAPSMMGPDPVPYWVSSHSSAMVNVQADVDLTAAELAALKASMMQNASVRE